MSIQFKPKKDTEKIYDEYAKIQRHAAKNGVDGGGLTIAVMMRGLDFELAKQGEP